MKKRFLASMTLLLICLVAFLIFGLRGASAAPTASLSLSPASGSSDVNGRITLDIHENSGTDAVNAVEADLSFLATEFNVISVTVASGWTNLQTYTCDSSLMQFYAYKLPLGSNVTGDQVVGTVVLQSINNNPAAVISFANTSGVFADDGLGTDIWDGNTTGGTYSISGNAGNEVHLCGTFVKASGGSAVYMISEGAKRPFSAANVFLSYGLGWGVIATMTSSDQALPVGVDMPFREGTLIKGTGAGIYAVDNYFGSSQKRAFSSWNAFTGLGYSLKDVTNVTNSQLSAIADGSDISDATEHPAGTLIKASGSPTVYLTSNFGPLSRFVEPYSFISNGYSFGNLKAATSADLLNGVGVNMTLRPGTLVKGSAAAIYVVDDQGSGLSWLKRPISTWATFTGLGYTFSQVMIVPDSLISGLTTGSSL